MRRAAVLGILAAAQAVAQNAPAGAPLTASEIMQRAADKMDAAEKARARYVYDQDVFVRLKRANGKTAREESREYTVAPGAKGATRTLVKVDGKVFKGKRQIPYSEPGFETGKIDVDASLTDGFASDLLWNKDGKVESFPIDHRNVNHYEYTLEGKEQYRGYDVYRISYRAKSKSVMDDDDDDTCWAGDALIERNQFQPVLLTSSWDCKIPVAVKALLGINVQHIGAKITFRRFDKDVWFPVSCGGEMKLRLFFLYARTIAFRASADHFRKTDVKSSIQFEAEAKQ